MSAVGVFFVFSVIVVVHGEETCDMTACEAYEKSQMDLRELMDTLEDNKTDSYFQRLERRLRSLEQPGNNVEGFVVFSTNTEVPCLSVGDPEG